MFYLHSTTCHLVRCWLWLFESVETHQGRVRKPLRMHDDGRDLRWKAREKPPKACSYYLNCYLKRLLTLAYGQVICNSVRKSFLKGVHLMQEE